MKYLSIPEVPALLKSKRFWVLIISLVAYVANEELGLQIDVSAWANIALALIAGYSIEDWISAWNSGKVAPEPEELAEIGMNRPGKPTSTPDSFGAQG